MDEKILAQKLYEVVNYVIKNYLLHLPFRLFFVKERSEDLKSHERSDYSYTDRGGFLFFFQEKVLQFVHAKI